jgi:hypothetical protein
MSSDPNKQQNPIVSNQVDLPRKRVTDFVNFTVPIETETWQGLTFTDIPDGLFTEENLRNIRINDGSILNLLAILLCTSDVNFASRVLFRDSPELIAAMPNLFKQFKLQNNISPTLQEILIYEWFTTQPSGYNFTDFYLNQLSHIFQVPRIELPNPEPQDNENANKEFFMIFNRLLPLCMKIKFPSKPNDPKIDDFYGAQFFNI